MYQSFRRKVRHRFRSEEAARRVVFQVPALALAMTPLLAISVQCRECVDSSLLGTIFLCSLLLLLLLHPTLLSPHHLNPRLYYVCFPPSPHLRSARLHGLCILVTLGVFSCVFETLLYGIDVSAHN